MEQANKSDTQTEIEPQEPVATEKLVLDSLAKTVESAEETEDAPEIVRQYFKPVNLLDNLDDFKVDV